MVVDSATEARKRDKRGVAVALLIAEPVRKHDVRVARGSPSRKL